MGIWYAIFGGFTSWQLLSGVLILTGEVLILTGIVVDIISKKKAETKAKIAHTFEGEEYGNLL